MFQGEPVAANQPEQVRKRLPAAPFDAEQIGEVIAGVVQFRIDGQSTTILSFGRRRMIRMQQNFACRGIANRGLMARIGGKLRIIAERIGQPTLFCGGLARHQQRGGRRSVSGDESADTNPRQRHILSRPATRAASPAKPWRGLPRPEMIAAISGGQDRNGGDRCQHSPFTSCPFRCNIHPLILASKRRFAAFASSHGAIDLEVSRDRPNRWGRAAISTSTRSECRSCLPSRSF